MTLPLEEGYVRDLAENAGRSAQVLEMHGEEIRRLQDEYSQFDPQRWRSGAGKRFLERLQDIVRDLSACGEALAAAAAARRELARTPQDKAWG
ncbi:hypothetical protein H9638_01745 [Arthrobacter sp. Sa2BUA2]|uniref:WXG100 family type VII secretion target n=1 Tax=Arthrobacter pullicola TaxID=2762224 RepID=A0ABR8YE72_9MICC|nr:hypothetical protein [Arthrobacter pullicola]MBD8042525.1 hypothetical protein [Arthrobacter pullicola]